MRLQKIIALAGIVSRRKAEEFISRGKVSVNGKAATIGMSANPQKDIILVNGQRVRPEKFVYIMLNKPPNYVSTVSEPFGMRTVVDLVNVPQRVYPVGRLDRDAEGLLILTNDGDFANRLMHPRYEVDKEYLIKIHAPLDDDREKKLKRGMVIEGRRVVPVVFEKLDDNLVRFAIKEGRKHIVKRVFERLGFRVLRLKRVRIGPLVLSGVKRGKWRFLSDDELHFLKNSASLK